jgi:hypothetical protein
MKIVCPKCGSMSITISRDHLVCLHWERIPDEELFLV